MYEHAGVCAGVRMPVRIAGVRCTEKSEAYTFGGAADRRHEGLCDKLATVLWRIVVGEYMICWIFEYDSWAT